MATEAPPKPGASRAQLYDYQSWIHVGPGADNCEDVDELEGTCTCGNPLHFHSWVRLPNPFQHREIRERAMAAKARRMRLLSDSSSDVSAILEAELEALARRGDAARAMVIDEIIQPDWWRYLLEATSNVSAQADKDGKLKWEHIDDDRGELDRLRSLADKEKDDEIMVLEKRLAAYGEARDAERVKLEKPLRDELEGLDISALVDRLRDVRLEAEGNEVFEHVYAEQMWLVCAYRQVDGIPVFGVIEELHRAPDGVIDALKSTFGDLEREKAGFSQRNS